MEHWKDRTRLLIGDEGINILRSKHVLVVGLGGVGAYAAEQLARAGTISYLPATFGLFCASVVINEFLGK